MRNPPPTSEDSGVFIIPQTGVSVTVLASGSRGNCTLLSSLRTRLLIDCGISCATVLRQLRAYGINPETVRGILVTHEHGDHIAGLCATVKHLNLPVLMTEAAHNARKEFFRDSSGRQVAANKPEFFKPGGSFAWVILT